jgi:hypothetical protein
MTDEQATPDAPDSDDVSRQARQQTGAKQVKVRMDESTMTTHYANAFRTNATDEEVMLDFGVNLPNPTAQGETPEILFRITDRIVLNYYSAKRLAITLRQIVQRYESQFGEMELNVANRRRRAQAEG